MKNRSPCFYRHSLGVHLDSDHVAAIAKQCLLELREANFLVAFPIAFLDHHLLGVMRPSFDVRTTPDQLPCLRWKLVCVQELNVVTGISFVDCDHVHDRRVKHPQVVLLVALIPVIFRRCHAVIGFSRRRS